MTKLPLPIMNGYVAVSLLAMIETCPLSSTKVMTYHISYLFLCGWVELPLDFVITITSLHDII